MLDFFRNLFAYDDWALRGSLSSIDEAKKSEATELLSHILYAEKIWLMRLEEDSSGVPVFGEFSFDECAAQASEISQSYRQSSILSPKRIWIP